MSRITIITVPNSNEAFTEIRAQYLRGNTSFTLASYPSDDTNSIIEAVQDFQAVADHMEVVVDNAGHFAVKGPDVMYHPPSDCVSASAYIADSLIAKRAAKRTP